ncbi:MAG TPA: uracil-DNA glycosylase [Acidimicrobiia bacterium]|nr:uracil-DNA glycosylase [Acidimicrobiia bacterium]
MTFHDGLIDCRLCPRLVEWRERKATVERRAAFADEQYWGRPVPAFGPIHAPILVVGLAPAAHGANRTGRMFTGDRSGVWVYRALHRAGLATSADDLDPRLRLVAARITAVCHCAPPDNKPTTTELDTCVTTWLVPEVEAMSPKVVVCLGGMAWNRVMRSAPEWGWEVPRPRPRFAHGMEVALAEGPIVLASYHPSQQNTFTGRLTEEMFDRIWHRAAELIR